jgi:NADH-quinone oxidoreductase subunit N
MGAKLWFLIPQMWLFAGAVVLAVMGLSRRRAVRDSLPLVTCAFLVVAAGLSPLVYDGARGTALLSRAGLLMPVLGKYVNIGVCVIGVLLAMVTVGLIDRRYEGDVSAGRVAFDPLRGNRGEFYALFMLSLVGVMLVPCANDLIWLFLALELTSLPTYVMVAISRPPRRAQEAAVKYFFLGAMAAAIFLYGFALLYGATGTLVLTEMRDAFEQARTAEGGIGLVGTVGLLLALLGIGFKIAAAPMHFYAADVYEGAAAPVTAFLGFVPKAAGLLALVLLLGTVGWGAPYVRTETLPPSVLTMLWMMAVLTMTLGNVGALLQRSVKRMLAYSSIAHSGYMLIGLIAGPGRGINAVLFYLLAYGLMNSAAFAVLAGLERRGQEIESMEDLAGLRHRHPGMAVVLAISAGSLLGVPPLLGFIGKFYLFAAGVEAGQIALVVIAGVNSAISAWYYLRLIGLPLLYKPTAQSETIVRGPALWPRLAGVLMAAALVAGPIAAGAILAATADATRGHLPELRLTTTAE